MNTPTYRIYGSDRRSMKKRLSELKEYVKTFWHFHNLDKDMASFFGQNGKYPMVDEEAQQQLDKANREIAELERLLREVY